MQLMDGKASLGNSDCRHTLSPYVGWPCHRLTEFVSCCKIRDVQNLTPPTAMPVEQIVGHQMARARERRGFSQAELGQELARYLGKPWSRQTVSVAEKGGRAFIAAELAALAHLLEVPIEGFFKPPPDTQGIEITEGVVIDRTDLAERTLPADLTAEARSDMQEVLSQLRRLDAADDRNRAKREQLHTTLEMQLDEGDEA